MENKFHNGKIYMLINETTPKVYIGSTIMELELRYYKHIIDYQNDELISSCDVLDCEGECMIVLLEDYPCENEKELRFREQYYIDKFREDGCEVVNRQNAITTPEQKREKQKTYYQENREYIVARQYHYDNKPENKVKKKEYADKNRERIRKNERDRYHKNKNMKK